MVTYWYGNAQCLLNNIKSMLELEFIDGIDLIYQDNIKDTWNVRYTLKH
jgi:hypothetical protein